MEKNIQPERLSKYSDNAENAQSQGVSSPERTSGFADVTADILEEDAKKYEPHQYALRAVELMREGRVADAIRSIEEVPPEWVDNVKTILRADIVHQPTHQYLREQSDYHNLGINERERLGDEERHQLNQWEQQRKAEFYRQHPEVEIVESYVSDRGASADEALRQLAVYEGSTDGAEAIAKVTSGQERKRGRLKNVVKVGAKGIADFFGLTESSDRSAKAYEERLVVDQQRVDVAEQEGEASAADPFSEKDELVEPEEKKRRRTAMGALGYAATWAYAKGQTAVFEATERVNKKSPEKVRSWLEATRTRRVLGRVAVAGVGIGAAYLTKYGFDTPDINVNFSNPFDSWTRSETGEDSIPTPSPGEVSPSDGTSSEGTNGANEGSQETDVDDDLETTATADDLMEQHEADVDEVRTIDAGEGAYTTFEQMGIDSTVHEELWKNDELREHLIDANEAYIAGDGFGWNTDTLSDDSIEKIYDRATELAENEPDSGDGMDEGESAPEPEQQEGAEDSSGSGETEPGTDGGETEPAPAQSEIEEVRQEAFNAALEAIEGAPVEQLSAFNIPQGSGGEQLIQAINRDFLPNEAVQIDQRAWYVIQDELLAKHPTEFYREGSEVRLMNSGLLSNDAKNSIVDALRNRGLNSLGG